MTDVQVSKTGRHSWACSLVGNRRFSFSAGLLYEYLEKFGFFFLHALSLLLIAVVTPDRSTGAIAVWLTHGSLASALRSATAAGGSVSRLFFVLVGVKVSVRARSGGRLEVGAVGA